MYGARMTASSNVPDEKPASAINPWLVILLTAPVMIAASLFFYFRWNQQRTDFATVTGHFLERQNRVLAQNALTVSQHVTGLLDGLARDVRLLSLVTPLEESFLKFYEMHTTRVSF